MKMETKEIILYFTGASFGVLGYLITSLIPSFIMTHIIGISILIVGLYATALAMQKWNL